jgi:hypothetical protein
MSSARGRRRFALGLQRVAALHLTRDAVHQARPAADILAERVIDRLRGRARAWWRAGY